MRDEHGMSADRFATLAEVCGADLRRWPAADRTAAKELLAGDRPDASAIVAREGRLDAWLDTYSVRAPSAALIGRVLAAAPQPALLLSRARLWWSGLGLAGIGLAGALTGALALPLATPALLDQRAAPWGDGQTIFGDVDLDGIAYE